MYFYGLSSFYQIKEFFLQGTQKADIAAEFPAQEDSKQ
jgi:hypothetical protein